MKIFAGTLLWIFIFSGISNGQTYSFKTYGAENNIPNGFIYTINQSDDGFLWVGTGNGLARFDGYNFYTVHFPDSSLLRYATSSLKDKITWLFMYARNKVTQTSSQRKLYLDDTTTVAGTSGTSDNGTTFTKGEDALRRPLRNAAWRPALRPENIQSAIDKPLT